MRAAVDVGAVATLEVDHEPFDLRPAPSQRELCRRAGRDVRDRGGPLLPVAHAAYDTMNRVTATGPAVEVRDLGKTFRTGWPRRRSQPALRGVSFVVPRGAIFGILGPNGAGKTTLLSILATLLLPDRGEARVLGLDVVRDAHRVRERINLSSGSASFLWSLTPREILDVAARSYGLGGAVRRPRVAALLEQFELTAHAGRALQRAVDGAQAAARARQGLRQRSGAPDPGRADRGARPRHLGAHPGPDRGAPALPPDDDPPVHALHAGGGAALRRDRVPPGRSDPRAAATPAP